MPILEGLDGVQRMSKSLSNYIAIADSFDEMFGKIMSISDDLMWRYFELLSFRTMTEISQWKKACDEGENPRNYKVNLAQEIVTRFHSISAAKKALENFEARFQRGAMPDDMDELEMQVDEHGVAIANILKDAGLTKSTSDAMRMIKQGAVKIDGEKISEPKLIMSAATNHVYQVGKRRFARIKLKAR